MNILTDTGPVPDSCDRCKSPGKFRGNTCYGCIQTRQELERAITDITAAQICAVYLDEHDSELGDKTRRLMTQAIERLEALKEG
jgi:hypothetical protein